MERLSRELVSSTPHELPDSHAGNGDDASPASSMDKPIHAWPVLSPAALHGLAGDVVRLACKDSEADPAAVLYQFLAAAGAAFGRTAYVPINATKHHANLFIAIVGASAKARKGTSADPVEELIRRVSSMYELPGLKISGGPLSTGEGLINAVRDASDKVDKGGELVDEGVKDKRLLVIDGEFSSALKVMQREGNTLSSVMRSAWDGKTLEPLTKSNRIRATDPHIAIAGHITQEELKDLLLHTSNIWNGWANRLLWVCARRQKLVAEPKALDKNQLDALAAELARVISMVPTSAVSWSGEAQIMWQKLYPILSGDSAGVIGAVTARSEAQALRLSLIYALLDGSAVIEIQHLKAGLAAWQYCLNSANYIFGGVVADPLVPKILEELREGEKTQTQMSNAFGRNVPSDRLVTALKALQDNGRITCRKQSEGRGRAASVWSMTPGFEST